jgi:very-short-patch-repair endonuclease
MACRGSVLVAILNNHLDYNIAREQRWYRIPVASVKKWLSKRWPPEWLAFYQTKVFGEEAYAVHHYAQVTAIEQVYRWQLFPNEPRDEQAERRYYRISLGELQELPAPIPSKRLRRIVFIQTTWTKFISAHEINDLYVGSPLEELLWQELKRTRIPAERQELIEAGGLAYFLDFAIYCAKGNLDVETDGDSWHANPERAERDNIRNNNLEAAGWSVLRFGTRHITEELTEYCIPKIVRKINGLGGVDDGGILPRKVNMSSGVGAIQPGLFDGMTQASLPQRRQAHEDLSDA